MVINYDTLLKYSSYLVTIFPFCFGTLYAYYRYDTISIFNGLILLIGLFFINIATSLRKQRLDTRNVHHHHIKQLYTFTIFMILILLLTLTLQTNWTVFLLFILTLLCHSFFWLAPEKSYTTILVGVGSGIFMTILTVYVHAFDQAGFSLNIFYSPLEAFINLSNVLAIITVSIPLMASATNLYFSKLLKNHFHDIPIFEDNILIYFALSIIGYAAIILGIINKSLPVTCILTSFTIYPVIKNMIIFSQNPHRSINLITLNYLLFNSVYLVSLALELLLK